MELLTWVKGGLGDVGGKGLRDRVAELPALVDDHAHNHRQVCHRCFFLLFRTNTTSVTVLAFAELINSKL